MRVVFAVQTLYDGNGAEETGYTGTEELGAG